MRWNQGIVGYDVMVHVMLLQGIVGYGMVYQYGMVCQYGMMLVCYVIVCQYGMMLVSQGIVGYDMVYYTCMHDLEVETHVNLV